MMLVSESNNKVIITIMFTEDLIKKGLHAGHIINEVSKEINGGGGGQSFLNLAEETMQKEYIHQLKNLRNY